MNTMTTQTQYEIFCHPFLIAVAGGLNLPPILFGILGYVDYCSNFSAWLVSNASLGFMNILGALYFVYQIRKSYKPAYPGSSDESNCSEEGYQNDLDGGGDNDPVPDEEEDFSHRHGDNKGHERSFLYRLLRRRTTSSDRIRHLICYDGFMATYAILFLFWVAWLSEGTQRLNSFESATDDDREGCIEFHERYMRTSTICGFCYAGCVVVSMLGALWK